MYKKNCGFKKVGVCSFKEQDCKPEICDMYKIEFNSKSIKLKIKELEEELKKLTKEYFSIRKVKRMLKIEKKDEESDKLKDYKTNLKRIEDLGYGLQYMKKAYTYCKRTRK